MFYETTCKESLNAVFIKEKTIISVPYKLFFLNFLQI
jgi:hypothetical protein